MDLGFKYSETQRSYPRTKAQVRAAGKALVRYCEGEHAWSMAAFPLHTTYHHDVIEYCLKNHHDTFNGYYQLARRILAHKHELGVIQHGVKPLFDSMHPVYQDERTAYVDGQAEKQLMRELRKLEAGKMNDESDGQAFVAAVRDCITRYNERKERECSS